MGSVQQEGGSEARGSPTGFPVPKWTGKALAVFPSVPLRPSPTISPRVSPIATGPLNVRGSHWVWELLPSPSHPSGVLVPEVQPLLWLPLPSLPLPPDLHGWRGPGGQRIRPRIPKWTGETWPHSVFDPLLSQWSPNFPLPTWDLFPPPATPQWCWSCLLLPPHSPHVLPGHSGVPPISLGVKVPHERLAATLVLGDVNSESSPTAILTPPSIYYSRY